MKIVSIWYLPDTIPDTIYVYVHTSETSLSWNISPSLHINQVVSRAQPSFHLLLIPTCCSSSQACEVAAHRRISQGTRGLLLPNCPHQASKGQKWTGMRRLLAAALPDKEAQIRPCGHPWGVFRCHINSISVLAVWARLISASPCAAAAVSCFKPLYLFFFARRKLICGIFNILGVHRLYVLLIDISNHIWYLYIIYANVSAR